MVSVGVIDSGLHSHVATMTIAGQHDFTGANTVEDLLGHGSAVANTIARTCLRPDLRTHVNTGADNEIRIVSARIFHDRLCCSPATVVRAIDWLLEMDVDVINMSFGLPNDREILRKACEKALANDLIIVASAPAQGKPVFPSHYSGVIRATGDARCQPGQISWLNSVQADFAGYAGNRESGIAGASIGCASVTGKVAQLIANSPLMRREQLIDQLSHCSSYRGVEQRSPKLPSVDLCR